MTIKNSLIKSFLILTIIPVSLVFIFFYLFITIESKNVLYDCLKNDVANKVIQLTSIDSVTSAKDFSNPQVQKKLNQLMPPDAELGYYIFSSDGTLLFRSKSETNYDFNTYITKKLSKNELSSSPLAHNQIIKSNHAYLGYDYQSFFHDSLILVVYKPYLNPLITLNSIPFLFLFLFVILLCCFISYRYYNRYYLIPVKELLNSVQTAAAGDLCATSNVVVKNEVGEFSKYFNQMLRLIKSNYDELSSVHERMLESEHQLKSNYDRIEYLAYHDILTDLPNRLCFNDYMTSILSTSDINKTIHAIFFIDLDNFKVFNDTLGHDYGDLLLQKISERLLSIVTNKNSIARAGGDEFMIMLPNLQSKEQAIAFAQQIIDNFQFPVNLNGENVYVSLSIGISLYPENGQDCITLSKNADIAMYHSKDIGKNCYTLFNTLMEENLHRKNLVLEVLRQAINNSEVYLLYQPQVNLKENRIVAFEALMRIYNPKLGSISPKEFIPIAEESGLIIELGNWALREACRFNQSLIKLGMTPCVVAVNISSVQLNHFNFFDTLSAILKETELPPQYLELELTESTLVSSIFDTATIIQRLHSIGVKVALDDFGTGYSSLSYLAKMNIHTLKIDKSFIDNICVSEKELFMVHTIIRLARHLGIQVVVEGVEHSAQLILLKEKKCDIVQGFVFSKPLIPNDLIYILKKATIDQII